jgi:hypothetical protein
MSSVEPAFFHVAKVLDKYSLIGHSSVALGFKMLHRVQVRNIDSSSVRGGAIMTVLVNIHSEDKSVNTVNLLKQRNAFASDWKLGRASICRVSLKHLRAHVTKS